MLQIRLTRNDDVLRIRMLLHLEAAALIRKAGAKWNDALVCYTMPWEDAPRLHAVGLTPFLVGDVPPLPRKALVAATPGYTPSAPPKNPAPFPHQLAGVEWLESHHQDILADQQGLGKTREALDYLRLVWLEDPRPAIVVTKHALLSVWEDEIRKWGDDWKVVTVDGAAPKRQALWGKADGKCIILLTYDMLKAKDSRPHLEFRKWSFAVLDECHLAKNGRSARGRAIHQIRSPRRLAMSGTPVINNPWEIYNILRWLGIESRSYMEFVQAYGEPDEYQSWSLAPRHALRYQAYIGSHMLRRTKDEVLDLPPKIYQTIRVEMTPAQKSLYYQLLTKHGYQKNGEWVEFKEGLPLLTKLYQCTSGLQCFEEPPSGGKIDALKELLEDRPDEKVVVFSRWLATVHAVADMFPNSVRLVGGMSSKDTEHSWRSFQTDPAVRLFVGSIDACREGLTLHKAETVIFLERPWAPGYSSQVEDRTHRAGLDHAVNIIDLVVPKTMDEYVLKVIDSKRNLEALLRTPEGIQEAMGFLKTG